MPDIAKARTINGWMEDNELFWLAEQAERYNLIVEIGSYRGRSTRALGDNTKGIVFAIDHWNGETHLNMCQAERDKLYDDFCTNLIDLIRVNKVIPTKVNHAEINTIPMLKESRPDFVFVDGSHAYDDVKRDIQTWMPKIIPSGMLAGHDSGFAGVRKAIDELVPGYKLVKDTALWYTML